MLKTLRSGVQRSSIEKVLKVIEEEKDNALTPSNIALKTGLQIPTVRSCVDFLSDLGKVEIIKSKRTWLVRKKVTIRLEEDKNGSRS